MVDWSGVRLRVTALAGDARAGELFGAGGHHFRLGAPLSGRELAEAEAQFGVRLPEQYRDFMRQVGAGGAGPFYGIFSLTKANGSWTWEGDGAELTDVARLAEPFSRTGADPQALDALLADRPTGEVLTDDEYRDAYEAWDKRRENLLWNPDRTAGAICLCHEGCAYRYWLVVSGPERGTIWSDQRAADVDLEPTGSTFGRWYLDWLATQETALPRR